MEPEVEILQGTASEFQELLLGLCSLVSEAQVVQEMPCQGDDKSCMVQATDEGIQGIGKDGLGGDGSLDVSGPGDMLVRRQGHREVEGVDFPAENNLDFVRDAFGMEFGFAEDAPAREGFSRASVRSTGGVDGQGNSLGGTLPVGGGVEEDQDEIINEAVNTAGGSGGHVHGGGEGWGGFCLGGGGFGEQVVWVELDCGEHWVPKWDP